MRLRGFVVDSNVISEVMRPSPEPRVMRWLNAHADEDLYLSTTILAELLSGLASMPDGKRKIGLEQFFRRLRGEWFAGRVLPFTEEAAEQYAAIKNQTQLRGRRIEIADGQIAAVAAVYGFVVVTRDTAPFEAAGLTVINPWEA